MINTWENLALENSWITFLTFFYIYLHLCFGTAMFCAYSAHYLFYFCKAYTHISHGLRQILWLGHTSFQLKKWHFSELWTWQYQIVLVDSAVKYNTEMHVWINCSLFPLWIWESTLPYSARLSLSLDHITHWTLQKLRLSVFTFICWLIHFVCRAAVGSVVVLHISSSSVFQKCRKVLVEPEGSAKSYSHKNVIISHKKCVFWKKCQQWKNTFEVDIFTFFLCFFHFL